MKRVLSLALALIMILSLAVFTFADTLENGILHLAKTTSGATYTLYKVFPSGLIIPRCKSGSVEQTALYTAVASADEFELVEASTPGYYHVYLSKGYTGNDIVQWIEKNFSLFETSNITSKTANSDSLSFGQIGYGYFAIKSDNTNDYLTAVLLNEEICAPSTGVLTAEVGYETAIPHNPAPSEGETVITIDDAIEGRTYNVYHVFYIHNDPLSFVLSSSSGMDIPQQVLSTDPNFVLTEIPNSSSYIVELKEGVTIDDVLDTLSAICGSSYSGIDFCGNISGTGDSLKLDDGFYVIKELGEDGRVTSFKAENHPSSVVASFANPESIPTHSLAPLPTGTGSITINNSQKGQSYTIYKLFDAEVGTPETAGATAPISYSVNKSTDPEVYNAVEKASTHFTLTPTADPNVFQVDRNANISDDHIIAWIKLYYKTLNLAKKTLTAESDTLTFDNIAYGYYIVEADGADRTYLTVNSTNPDVNVNIKVPHNPSNPQKVQDKNEVKFGDIVTYNASVKAVNNYVDTSDFGSFTAPVTMYIVKDFCDDDAVDMDYLEIRVYTAADLDAKKRLDTNGNIKIGDNGLLDLDDVTYTTVPASTSALSWTDTEPTDGYYYLKDDINIPTPNNMIKTVGNVKYDLRFIAIPWQDGDGSFMYDSNSYIVLTYTQEVGAGIHSIGGIGKPDGYDGVFSNTVEFSFVHGDSTTDIGDSVTVNAYSTSISLSKLYDQDDSHTLSGAQFKLQNAEGNWYKDNYAERNEAMEYNAIWVTEIGKGTKNAKEVPDLEITWVPNEADAKVLRADNSNHTIEIYDLCSGDYILKETKTPDGYTVPSYQWNLRLKFDPDATGATPAESVTSGIHYTLSMKKTTDPDTEYEGIAINDKGYFTVKIINTKGNPLPTTGGAGTVALVALGTLLFIATGVVLVTKKRLYNEG